MTRREANEKVLALTANTAATTEQKLVAEIRAGDALTGLWNAKVPVIRVTHLAGGATRIWTFDSYSCGKSRADYPKGDRLWVFPALARD